MRAVIGIIFLFFLVSCSNDKATIRDKLVYYLPNEDTYGEFGALLSMSCTYEWGIEFTIKSDQDIQRAKIYLDDKLVLSDPYIFKITIYLEEKKSIFDAELPQLLADGNKLTIEYVVDNSIESAEFNIGNIDKHFRHLKKNCKSVD